MNPKREYKENNGESKGEEIILKKKKIECVYQTIDSDYSINSKQDYYKHNHNYVHHSQTADNQAKENCEVREKTH